MLATGPVELVATTSRYSPKNIKNDQDLNELLIFFTNGYKILLVNTFKMHLIIFKTIKI